MLTDVPAGYWRISPDALKDHERLATKRGGYVQGFEKIFRQEDFGISTEEILNLEPLHHWILQGVADALRSAGVTSRPGPRGGLILGNLSYPSEGLARFAESVWLERPRVDPRARFMSGFPVLHAARVHGLEGDSFAVDAACASSLYAIKLACDRLQSGAMDVMVAGGVNRADNLFLHMGFSALGAISRSGQSRPFHRDADGLLPAEGMACFVLRRLEEAIAHSEPILGVIRGIGLSNDGRHGFLAPSEEGQFRAMENAYRSAGIDPSEISLVECHATGTPTGDSVEIRSMSRVFAGLRDIPIGSVKSNTGHLLAAAGAAGLAKVLGAFHSGIRPPTLHAKHPIDALEGSPFRLLAEAEAWEAVRPRCAAVSAFGFGGNNAHLIVEEWTGENRADGGHLGRSNSENDRCASGQSALSKDPARCGLEGRAPLNGTPAIAIVGIGAWVSDARGTREFEEALFSGERRLNSAGPVEFRPDELRFPPKDLAEALPQQLVILKAANDAISEVAGLPADKTSVLIGMQCDAEVARYGVRWRLSDLLAGNINQARDEFQPALKPAGVIGTMPNIVANRINNQHDFTASGFVISAEELSGFEALRAGIDSLQKGEVDAAIIGAVDLCREPVQEAAGRAVLPEGFQIPGDAAVALVLKRLDDARRDGNRIYACVAAGATPAHEPNPLIPSFSPSGGEGARRAVEGDSQRFMAPTHVHTSEVFALREPEDRGQAVPTPMPRSQGGAVAPACLSEVQGPPTGARHKEISLDRLVFPNLTAQFGHSHSATALLHVAAAAMTCSRRAIPGGVGNPAVPWLSGPSARTIEVRTASFAGRSGTIAVTEDVRSTPSEPGVFPALHCYSGANSVKVLQALRENRESSNGVSRLVLVAASEAELLGRREAAMRLLDRKPSPSLISEEGIFFREKPIQGEIAFVYSFAAASYAGMGRDLLLAMPALLDRGISKRFPNSARSLRALYSPGAQIPDSLAELRSYSFLCHVHTRLSRDIFGLKPDAAIGISTGESSALFCLGAWNDPERMLEEIDRSGLYSSELDGEFRSVREAWNGHEASGRVDWANWRIYHPVNQVREALSQESRAHLTLVHTSEDCMIGGQAEACERVVARLGREHALKMPGGMAVHCPEVGPFAKRWRKLHHRETSRVADVRFYSNAVATHYEVDAEAAADALTRQALQTVDFPKTILKAWNDGVRIFVEHGPRGLCREWIQLILKDREHLVVTLDQAGRSSVKQACFAAAELLAAGVPVETAWVQLARKADATQKPMQPVLRFPAHRPQVRLTSSTPPAPLTEAGVQRMEPAPWLPLVLNCVGADVRRLTSSDFPEESEPRYLGSYKERTLQHFDALDAPEPLEIPLNRPAGTFSPSGGEGWDEGVRFMGRELPNSVLATNVAEDAPLPLATPTAALAVAPAPEAPNGLLVLQRRHSTLQQEWVRNQTELHRQFLAMRERALAQALRISSGVVPTSLPSAVPTTTKLASPPSPPPPPSQRPGPKLTREDLEKISTGKVSEIFGDAFARQDGYARQVRMPTPPLLLADRVLGIEGEPGSMGLGTIWTETDVAPNAWYLHNGFMPAGLMIEAGQADLLLVSWLGVDFENRGQRVYRLLGCELTYSGSLPRPGETLGYEIHVDGYARQDDVRLFFFHYDCQVNSQIRLKVRHGQAGFFSDEELANSMGVLWDAATADIPQSGRCDAPFIPCPHSRFGTTQIQAFASGKLVECFGPGFAMALTHTRTPGIPSGKLLLFDEVHDFDSAGGPWGRGYLKSSLNIHPDHWFFEGHFKNDPCMPGTLMFEGCLQTMAFYLSALGYSLERDGWRFEPVPDEPYRLSCRGQVLPSSRELVYEVFVREVHAGPVPTLFADLLCTVDGLKAFHCERMGYRLVPDWPLSSRPELPGSIREKKPVARVNGFEFGYASLLACAWGKPSDAFGEMYRMFDGTRRVARLPGPPYHFMTRVIEVHGAIGIGQAGASVVIEYDIPDEAWYFADNGCQTMPFAVLLEAALQPCGWLASYVGCATHSAEDLSFRNLDGQGTVFMEVPPGGGALKTSVKLTTLSKSAGTVILAFDATCTIGSQKVYALNTVFGFFPKEALANQVGLPTTGADREWLEKPSDFLADLATPSAESSSEMPRLARPILRMIDRVTGYWPEAGRAGLGRLRAEKQVDPSEWFFKAHFFQDPVMPGSLGIEAMLQLLQFYMIERGLPEGIARPRFEPLAVGDSHTWKYRGQIIPTNKRITTEIEVLRVDRDERGVFAFAEAWLWVDGKKIYQASIGMRIVPGDAEAMHGRSAAVCYGTSRSACESKEVRSSPARRWPADAVATGLRHSRAPVLLPGPAPQEAFSEIVIDAEKSPWILDHRPTYTLPALPFMSLLDLAAAQAQADWPAGKVMRIENLQVHRWALVNPAARLRIRTFLKVAADVRRITSSDLPEGSEPRYLGSYKEGEFASTNEIGCDVTIELWRDAGREELSRYENLATARVFLAEKYAEPPLPCEALTDAVESESPYTQGALFHGPSFQVLKSLVIGRTGSSSRLDSAIRQVPLGLLHPALLDGATHGIPHDHLDTWCDEIAPGQVAYPVRITSMTIHGATPVNGEVRCEARFDGFDGDRRFPAFRIQLLIGDRVWIAFRLVEALFPKGPIGSAPALERKAFLRDRASVRDLGLSRFENGATCLTPEEFSGSDWFPGTIASAYALNTDRPVEEVAVKDHIARLTTSHPSSVRYFPEQQAATCSTWPLNRFPLQLQRSSDGAIQVRNAGPSSVELGIVLPALRGLFGGISPEIEKLYGGLARKFVARVELADVSAMEKLRGRSVLYLANHQSQIESILFSMLVSGIQKLPVVVLANAKHRDRWVGQLVRQTFAGTGSPDPELIRYFDQDRPELLTAIIDEIGREMMLGRRSLMVHVEGTRQKSCRDEVRKVSSVFPDLSVRTGVPIVPVRFARGLPVAPLTDGKLEFPVGYCGQEYRFGTPIFPEELQPLSLAARRDLILNAIRQLGDSTTEVPGPARSEFAAAVAQRMSDTGVSEVDAVLATLLGQAAIECANAG